MEEKDVPENSILIQLNETGMNIGYKGLPDDFVAITVLQQAIGVLTDKIRKGSSIVVPKGTIPFHRN